MEKAFKQGFSSQVVIHDLRLPELQSSIDQANQVRLK